MRCEILKDIRILDLGSFIAGPASTQFLGFLGAEVIKIEHPLRPDGGRVFSAAPHLPHSDPRTAANQVFSLNNLSKLGVAIDFSTEEGRRLIIDLVKSADIVCENMSVGALDKYGLGYQGLRKIKPDIIYLASSSCGEGGPDEDFIGYASTFACKVGLGALTGYEGSPPSTFVGSIDIRSATNAALAMLAALYFRKTTGKGQRIEISSQEAIASQLGDVYLDYIINNNNQGRTANIRIGYSPQGVYCTDVTDAWVALSVESEEDWKSLCKAMNNPALARDPRFADCESRTEGHEALDAIINGWTSGHSRAELLHILQEHGIACGPVYDGKGVYEDPHRIERESYFMINSRDLGKECIQRPAWRYEKTPTGAPEGAPHWGEHTIQVLKNVLHKTDREIQSLSEKKVVRRMYDGCA